jgi:hypothetical protein
MYNYDDQFSYEGKDYDRSDYWDRIDDILDEMKDNH